MTRPTSRSTTPLVLDEVRIPYRQTPNPPMPADTWGINIAAVEAFPDGLLVEIPPWDADAMGKGDSVNLRLNNNVVDSAVIMDDADVGKLVKLFIEADRLTNGDAIVDYVVTRVGDPTPEGSSRTKIYIKLTRPGGKDENGSIPGHSELHMAIPEDILQGGVDADTPFVPITIKSPIDGAAPYPNIAEGDRIVLSWGGWFVEDTVTKEQANDPANYPIILTVDKNTINDAGDSDDEGLPVAFFIRDVVNNRSEDWSAEVRIVVDTGQSRLLPPLIEETFNDVLDMDDLPDPDTVTAQVMAMASYGFAMGDEIEMRLKGTTEDGEVVDKTYPWVRIESTNKVIYIPLPSADVRPLVNTRVVFSYRLIKADGSADQFSKGLFVRVVGEARLLAAPIAEDAIAGTLDPALPRTIIQIPWDDSMAAGQVIELQWFGTRANDAIYFPSLPPHPISNGEGQAKQPIPIPVDGEHLRPLEGGTLELFYLLYRDADARDIVRRESLHAERLNIGEPVAELPPPVVEGEQAGVLDPEDKPAGTRLIVPHYTGQTSGDEVYYAWKGSKTGMKSDSVKVTGLNENDDIPFSITFALIKGNEGGTVEASYWVKRVADGRYSPSEVLRMRIGAAMNLLAPSVKQATGTVPNQQLNPVAAKDALTVVIPEYGILPGDEVSVTWTGTAGEGSHTTAAQALPSSREIPLPVEVLAYNLGKPVTVTYTVIRNGEASDPSAPLNLAVQLLAPGDLSDSTPRITQAANNGEGSVLDLNNVTGGGTVRIDGWPHIAIGQYVWLRLKGFKADGSAHNRTLWEAPSRVTPGEYDRNYLQTTAPYDYLKDLGDGSTLTVEFKVAFGQSTDEAQAFAFPLRTYSVSAIALIAPTLIDITDTKGSVVGGTTVETRVTVTGTGSSDQLIQLMDGANNIGDPIRVPNDSTNWSATLTGLTDKAYSIKARALYGSGLPDSAAKAFSVAVAAVPAITSVKNSQGDEIINGSTTVTTSVTLTGTATAGFSVEILDKGVPKGTFVATGGIWTTTAIAVDPGDHSFTAKALYGSEPVSPARTFNVVNAATPTITSVKDSRGVEINNNTATVTPSVTLTGTATAGFSVDILDNSALKGTFVATGGIWTTTAIAVGTGNHSFTAKAKYGSEPVSAARTFTVVTLTDQQKPYIQQAENNGTGAVLDLSTFSGNATVKVTPWPGIAAGQKVWLRCQGKKANGEDHIITLYTSSGVTTGEVSNGLSKSVTRAQLELLGNNTSMTVELKVTFNGSSAESEATAFPLRTYTVKTLEVIAPTLTDIRDSRGSVVGGTTVETSVNVTGTGSRGQQIQLMDGGNNIGDAVDIPSDSTTWNTRLTGLGFKTYGLKAKALYGSGQESAVSSFTVLAPLTIDPAQMVLNTWIFLSSSGGVPPNPPPGAYGVRQPTGGVPPYQYSSSNPNVAYVDSTGKVTSFGNGSATITVVDQAGQSVSYPVAVSNVFVAFGTGVVGTYNQCSSAASAQGGRLPSLAEWQRMRSDYNGAPGVSANWTWSTTAFGIGYVYGIQTENGQTKALESVLGRDRADGFGLRAK